ncbi:MAG TPA: SDR family oxidoreductase [Acidobacteriota bacterium]|nr:SDR family oxidoreductase [Acidobacteriota bacterium]
MPECRVFLVTGGAGFIGSHICEWLLRRGDSVRILDNFSSGKRSTVSRLKKRYPNQVEVFDTDIRDYRSLRRATQNVAAVFHQAAIVSVQKSVEDPLEAVSVNLEGTAKVFQAAKESGVQKVVFASSTAVYGNSEELPKSESMSLQPLSPYAATKEGGEIFGRIFSMLYGLPIISLRYFNVFGPRQDPATEYAAVIPRFISRMMAGDRPVIYGDGEQTRDFVYVDDIVRANLLAAESPVAGIALNIASGQRYSLNSLVLILNDVLNLDFQPKYEPARPGEVRHSLADISLATKTLGYRPEVSLREGLLRTIAWFREKQNHDHED